MLAAVQRWDFFVFPRQMFLKAVASVLSVPLGFRSATSRLSLNEAVITNISDGPFQKMSGMLQGTLNSGYILRSPFNNTLSCASKNNSVKWRASFKDLSKSACLNCIQFQIKQRGMHKDCSFFFLLTKRGLKAGCCSNPVCSTFLLIICEYGMKFCCHLPILGK